MGRAGRRQLLAGGGEGLEEREMRLRARPALPLRAGVGSSHLAPVVCKLWCLRTTWSTGYYSALERKEILTQATPCDLEIVMLHEISQADTV